jgi:hypothetical protein
MDDLISTESAVVAAATAAVFSPKTRDTIRRGAVLGVAGMLKATDVVSGAARGVVRGVKGENPGETTAASNGAQAPTSARSRTAPSRGATGRGATGRGATGRGATTRRTAASRSRRAASPSAAS